MVLHNSFLVTLVQLVDRLPMPTPAVKRGRGRPIVYMDRLFRKRVRHDDCPSFAQGQ